MSLRLRALVVALCLLAPSSHAFAQQPSAPAAKPGAKAPSTRASADPLAAGRRATATNLLTSLADEARGFRDSTLRSRIQAQAADALWEADQERARTLFRRAWDAAEQADLDNTRRRQAEQNAPRTGAPGGGGPNQRTSEEVRSMGGRPGGLATTLNLPQMRSEVLRLAARRDRALGEEFLSKLEEARKQDEKTLAADSVAGAASAPAGVGAGTGAGTSGSPGSAAPRASSDPHETPPDDARRLRLAQQLLSEGDAEQALRFAEPALQRGINTAVVEFLVNLREKNPEAADQRFLALLARASAHPATNANAVLFISSYVLTPHMYMTIGPRGGISTSQRRGDITTPDLPAPVRTTFANFAAQVLTRPLPPPDAGAGAGDRASVYFVAGRLLPFIEAVAPQRAAALRAQMAAITPDVPQGMRDDMQDDMKRGFVPEAQQAGERMQQALDAASTATDPRRRDAAYLQAALIAGRREDPKARDYASKIEDADLRRQALAFVDFTLVAIAIRKGDGAEVLRRAQGGEITHTQRTWALSEASRLLVKDDRPRAVEALEAAFESAKNIDAEDPDRPRALVAVATQYAAIDRNRAWEMLAEAVKAANSAPDFTGADAGMAARVQTGGMSSTTNFPAPSFDLDGIFSALAREDMNRAVALAQTFTHESPRAVATLAVARAVLEDKPAAPRPNRAANQ